MMQSFVAVEKGTKAVISVNFSAYGKRRLNNLRANFVREIPREEFFNTYVSLPPLLTRWTNFQFDLLTRTFLHLHRRTICFLGLQKVGVDPDWLVQILPGIERVAARSQAANRKASMLGGRSDPEAIGKLAVFFLGHGYHGGVGHGMVVVYMIVVHMIRVRIFFLLLFP